MTVTTTRRAPAPAIAIDPRYTRRGELRPGLIGPAMALSADYMWMFTAAWRGAVEGWRGEYLPTGDTVEGRTLMACRRQAAAPDILDRFADRARAELLELAALEAGGAGDVVTLALGSTLLAGQAVRYALARRRLAVLTDRLVPAREPDGVCACGGFLIGGELHVDACPSCLELRPVDRIRCDLLVTHQACPTVDPVLCDHGCRTPARPAPCWRGRDFCCGCCDETGDGAPLAGPAVVVATAGPVRVLARR